MFFSHFRNLQAIREFSPNFREFFASFREFSRTFRNVRRSKRSENDSERSETAQNGAKMVRNGAKTVQNGAKISKPKTRSQLAMTHFKSLTRDRAYKPGLWRLRRWHRLVGSIFGYTRFQSASWRAMSEFWVSKMLLFSRLFGRCVLMGSRLLQMVPM